MHQPTFFPVEDVYGFSELPGGSESLRKVTRDRWVASCCSAVLEGVSICLFVINVHL